MPHELSDTLYTDYVRLQDLAGKYGGADGLRKKIDKLEEDGAGYRQSIKDLEAKTVPEGAKVLAGKDAEEYDAFKALGKTPAQLAAATLIEGDDKAEFEAFKALGMKVADIPGIVTERDQLKVKDTQRSRRDSIAAVVAAEKMPPESVDTIADLGSLSEATWEVKKEKGKDDAGKDVTNDVAYVTLPGQEPVKFSEYRESNAVLKGLRVETEKKEPDNRWPPQETRGKATATTPEDHTKAVKQQLDYNV